MEANSGTAALLAAIEAGAGKDLLPTGFYSWADSGCLNNHI